MPEDDEELALTLNGKKTDKAGRFRESNARQRHGWKSNSKSVRPIHQSHIKMAWADKRLFPPDGFTGSLPWQDRYDGKEYITMNFGHHLLLTTFRSINLTWFQTDYPYSACYAVLCVIHRTPKSIQNSLICKRIISYCQSQRHSPLSYLWRHEPRQRSHYPNLPRQPRHLRRRQSQHPYY